MKKILLLFVIMLGVITLIGCQGNPPQEEGPIVPEYDLPADANYDGSAVTVNFWHRMGAVNQAMIVKYIGEFKVLYPNITVVETKAANDYPGLADAISLAIPAGDEPDIAESYPDHIARYAEAKAPLPLNTFISNPNIGFSQAEIDDFLPGLWNEGVSYDKYGSRMSLPFSKSSEALFYNKTYFEANGYSVPETWEELFVISQQIRTAEALKGKNVVPFGYDSDDNLFITGSEQWGAPYTGYNAEGKAEVQFNNDASKDMIRYFKEKYDAGLLTTKTLNGGAYSSDMFKISNLFMTVGSTGGTRYNVPAAGTFEVGVAPVPHFAGKKQAQIQQGPNINLFKKNNQQQMIAAWLFAKYITGTNQTAEFATQSGYIPIRNSAFDCPLYKTWENSLSEHPTTQAQAQDKLVRDVFNVFREVQDSFFTSVVFNLGAKTRTEVGALLAEILAYAGSDLNGYIDERYREHYNLIIS